MHVFTIHVFTIFPELVTSQKNISENRKHALACTFDKFRESVEMALIFFFLVRFTTIKSIDFPIPN